MSSEELLLKILNQQEIIIQKIQSIEKRFDNDCIEEGSLEETCERLTQKTYLKYFNNLNPNQRQLVYDILKELNGESISVISNSSNNRQL